MAQYTITIGPNGSGPNGSGPDAEPDGDRALRSLARWLRDDDAIRTEAIVELQQAPPPPGAMGSAFDVIQLSVEAGFQLANLALAYVTWRSTRSRPPTVTVEHEGMRVELNTADPEEIVRLLARLRREG
ncbi:hypothetical protein ABZZ79_06345 [Streptomyces sp. NPDC006458]|uniref:effector-associated constant component EACC1 n=1 Tax=Streptomyces sp. NPDC006458 TaxID=3154302 RepID=UPI0033A8BB2E